MTVEQLVRDINSFEDEQGLRLIGRNLGRWLLQDLNYDDLVQVGRALEARGAVLVLQGFVQEYCQALADVVAAQLAVWEEREVERKI